MRHLAYVLLGKAAECDCDSAVNMTSGIARCGELARRLKRFPQ
jgi:hypothetical protein